MMFSFKKDAHGKYDLDDFINSVGIDNFLSYCASHLGPDVCEHFGITAHTLYNLKRKFNVPALTKEQVTQLSQEKITSIYGKDRAECVRRNKESKLRNHGDENYCNSEQAKKTVEERYGVNNITYIPGVSEKRRQTCLEKYGVDVSSKADSVKEKSKQSRIKHYGSYEESYKIGLENLRSVLNQKYGVDYFVLSDNCRKNLSYRRQSQWNKDFESMLKKHGIDDFEIEFRIQRKFYDFRIGKYLLEVDPYPTHNSTWSPIAKGPGIDKYYHRNKTLLAIENGYICVHIFDWTDVEKVLNLIQLHQLDIYDTGVVNRYIFNTKTKKLVDHMEKDCVEIYDDGFAIKEEVYSNGK